MKCKHKTIEGIRIYRSKACAKKFVDSKGKKGLKAILYPTTGKEWGVIH